MNDDSLMIVLRVGATSIEMADDAALRSQIEQNVLVRESRVIVYRGDAAGLSVRADTVPELRRLLDELRGVAEAPAPPDAVPAPAGPPPMPEASAPKPAAPKTAASTALAPNRPTPNAPSPPPHGAPAGVPYFGQTVIPDEGTLAPSAAGWLPWYLSAATGAKGVYFAVASISIRTAPSMAAPRTGECFLRGDRIAGEIGPLVSPGRRWLKLADGTGLGGFVLCIGLSPEPPPPLVGSPGRFRTDEAVVARTWPSPHAPPALALPANKLVIVEGYCDGWAEIRLPGGGVGYLP